MWLIQPRIILVKESDTVPIGLGLGLGLTLGFMIGFMLG